MIIIMSLIFQQLVKIDVTSLCDMRTLNPSVLVSLKIRNNCSFQLAAI